jgi:hypothetical protein
MTQHKRQPTGTAADRGEVHLGDLARALADLPWQDQAQARAIAASLGFGLGAGAGGVQRSSRPTEVYNPTAQPRHRDPARREPPPIPVPPLPPELPPLPADALPCRLRALDERAPAGPDPDWLGLDDAAPDPALDPFARIDALPCAREPLFPHRTARHILSAALALTRTGDAIDETRLAAALIDALARREPLRALPRRCERTLARGCDLLLDYSAGMVPFWDDLTGLIDQVSAVVGAEQTRVYSFDARPDEALRWLPSGRRLPWTPADRPVLAATDLGLQHGTAARPDPGWDRLGRRCAAAGLPLLILLPSPEHHWPPRLAGRPALIHWSPATSAALVQTRLRASGGRGGTRP